MSQLVEDTIKILEKARGLITDRYNWTTGSYARSADGDITCINDPKAICWCSLGAISKVAGDIHKEFNTVSYLTGFIEPDSSMARFNDKHSHEEVLALFDRAILSLKGNDVRPD